MRLDHKLLEIMTKDKIYIDIKCIRCGHTQRTDRHSGEEKCEDCERTIDIEKAYNFAKGDFE